MKTINARGSQRGFTLLELLLVVFLMGILAAVIIPNMITFFGTGNLAAAKTELRNVQTAASGYYSENLTWPSDSTVLTGFFDRDAKATYHFDTATGLVVGVSDVGWSGIEWNPADNTWTR